MNIWAESWTQFLIEGLQVIVISGHYTVTLSNVTKFSATTVLDEDKPCEINNMTEREIAEFRNELDDMIITTEDGKQIVFCIVHK